MAHIPDGFLSPAVLAGTAVLSVAALALASRRSRDQLKERQAPLLGAVTAFVFAAQMFNFPLGAGTSAHLLGGALVAVVAGPWAAMLALFSVVLVQALLFQDGGIAALGANALNLAVIGAGGGWLVYRWLLVMLGDGRRRRLAAAGTAGFISALASGLAAGAELGLSGLVPLRTAITVVGAAHVLVGAAEAAITVMILSLVLRSRPGLIEATEPAGPRARVAVLVGTAAAFSIALGAAPVGSGLPDALEGGVHRLGLGEGEALVDAPMAGYLAAAGAVPEAVAGAVGVAVVLGVAWLLFRGLGRSGDRRPA